jgi:hypothetical protein
VQGSFRKAGDAHTPDYVIGNTAFREMDGAVSVGYRKNRFALEAHYSHFGTELGIYRGAHIGNADDLLRVIERGEPAVDYDFGYGILPPKQAIHQAHRRAENVYLSANCHGYTPPDGSCSTVCAEKYSVREAGIVLNCRDRAPACFQYFG